ncbi:MAG: hypothetical protein ACJAUR_001886 [Ulvibacter sp.]
MEAQNNLSGTITNENNNETLSANEYFPKLGKETVADNNETCAISNT